MTTAHKMLSNFVQRLVKEILQSRFSGFIWVASLSGGSIYIWIWILDYLIKEFKDLFGPIICWSLSSPVQTSTPDHYQFNYQLFVIMMMITWCSSARAEWEPLSRKYLLIPYLPFGSTPVISFKTWQWQYLLTPCLPLINSCHIFNNTFQNLIVLNDVNI